MTSGDEVGAEAPTNTKSTRMEEQPVDFFTNTVSLVEQMKAKKRATEEKKRSSQSASVERVEPAVQDRKRRRISKNSDGDDSDGDGHNRTRTPSSVARSRNSESAKKTRGSPNTLSGRYSQLTGSQSKVLRSQSTNLGTTTDSDEDYIDRTNGDLPKSRTTNGKSPNVPVEIEDSLSDDEGERARLAAQRDKILAKMNNPQPPPPPQLSKEELREIKVKERFEQFKKTGSIKKTSSDSSTPREAPPAPVFDPKIKILITSEIEGMKQLIFILKASQRLQMARERWCDSQDIELTEEQKESIFLTWKGNKVWDSTTCKRMLDLKSEVVDMSGEGFREDQLHMVAWTKETWEQHERDEARRKVFPGDSQREASPEEEATPAPAEEKIRLILKGKGIDEFKLAVHSHTRIAKVISSLQRARDIPEDREIYLRFDGDLLEPESCVKDYDIEDKVLIEVQIK